MKKYSKLSLVELVEMLDSNCSCAQEGDHIQDCQQKPNEDFENIHKAFKVKFMHTVEDTVRYYHNNLLEPVASSLTEDETFFIIEGRVTSNAIHGYQNLRWVKDFQRKMKNILELVKDIDEILEEQGLNGEPCEKHKYHCDDEGNVIHD